MRSCRWCKNKQGGDQGRDDDDDESAAATLDRSR